VTCANAIHLAIDRDGLSTTLFGGLAPPARRSAKQASSRSVWRELDDYILLAVG
jgi:hypothetical protein